MLSQISPVVLNNLISVKDAAECSGFSLQHIRRLLRLEKLGQVWLSEMDSFETYLTNAKNSTIVLAINYFILTIRFLNAVKQPASVGPDINGGKSIIWA
jgi:hypothetical protein